MNRRWALINDNIVNRYYGRALCLLWSADRIRKGDVLCLSPHLFRNNWIKTSRSVYQTFNSLISVTDEVDIISYSHVILCQTKVTLCPPNCVKNVPYVLYEQTTSSPAKNLDFIWTGSFCRFGPHLFFIPTFIRSIPLCLLLLPSSSLIWHCLRCS